MSYKNDKKNKTIELDDRNIRSHLNTSLDLSGIRVSEDLINRTLAAIKEQPVTTDGNASATPAAVTHKKVISWSRYIRGFATVAAALVIVVAGYAAIKQLPIGMKSTTENTVAEPEISNLYAPDGKSADSQSMDAASSADQGYTTFDTPESAQGEASITTIPGAEEGSETALADTQFTISAETFAGSAEKRAEAPVKAEGENGDKENAADEDQNTGANSLKPKANMALRGTQTTLAFRDIFISSPEQAQYILITDHVNNTSVNLTDPADIEAFYQVMETHEFTSSAADTAAGEDYTVEMLDPDTQALYTMLVGNQLTVRLVQGEVSSESTYVAVNDELFKEDLQSFYTAHKK